MKLAQFELKCFCGVQLNCAKSPCLLGTVKVLRQLSFVEQTFLYTWVCKVSTPKPHPVQTPTAYYFTFELLFESIYHWFMVYHWFMLPEPSQFCPKTHDQSDPIIQSICSHYQIWPNHWFKQNINAPTFEHEFCGAQWMIWHSLWQKEHTTFAFSDP